MYLAGRLGRFDFDVVNTGDYSVNVAIGDCRSNDQVFIEVVTPFNADLPATTAFCAGDSVLLLAAFGASNYQWYICALRQPVLGLSARHLHCEFHPGWMHLHR